jgi:hypothetical protein
MPKNIVATPAAVVAVDRLILQVDDARGDLCSVTYPSELSFQFGSLCFSEE